MKTIIVTGGAGFIGSAVIRYLISETDFCIINIDKLTYAGSLLSLADIETTNRYHFIQADICNKEKMTEVFTQYQPNYMMHLAAESHVDRSIDGSAEFIQTNIVGTYTLLETARAYWQSLSIEKKDEFRFHHVSTDEVYGDLADSGLLFTEDSSYDPSSPYSASKASSDHLVRAWHRTYGLPTLISNCSNNYGPFHFPEKLIPLTILNALEGKALPIYGNGQQVRDWLYVEDHARALFKVVTTGKIGETYNIGGHNEKRNIDVVLTICNILDELVEDKTKKTAKFSDLITYVEDRPGHDLRYAIDANKISQQLAWQPEETFESGIRKTIAWYLNNLQWCNAVQQDCYQRERLGNNK